MDLNSAAILMQLNLLSLSLFISNWIDTKLNWIESSWQMKLYLCVYVSVSICHFHGHFWLIVGQAMHCYRWCCFPSICHCIVCFGDHTLTFTNNHNHTQKQAYNWKWIAEKRIAKGFGAQWNFQAKMIVFSSFSRTRPNFPKLPRRCNQLIELRISNRRQPIKITTKQASEQQLARYQCCLQFAVLIKLARFIANWFVVKILPRSKNPYFSKHAKWYIWFASNGIHSCLSFYVSLQ